MSLKEKIENDKLYQLLLSIKDKPEMYITDMDLNNLYFLIIGYNLYKFYNSIESDIDIFAINGKISFDEYVHNHYEITTTHNWFQIISFYSPNKKIAFNTFYELFFEYIDNCLKEENE